MLGLGNTLSGGIVPAAAAVSNAFTFTVNTENAGSATKTFVVPLNYISGHTWDIDIDWGDSSTDNITAYDQAELTHVYDATGTYTIQMTNPVSGFDFQRGGDKLKILNISKWGEFIFTGGASGSAAGNQAFRGCTNLTSDATDVPTIDLVLWNFMFEGCTNWNPNNIESWDMSSVATINWMFFNCSSFNQPIGAWDTSSVTNISYMLYGATSFDQNLANWNVTAITANANMDAFLTNVTLSTANYDALLIGWEGQSVDDDQTPNFGGSKYTAGGDAAAARQRLLDDHNWTITDGGTA